MRATAPLLFLVLASLTSTGWAQAPREGGVMFSWVRGEAAEGCLDHATMAQEIAGRLGYDPFQPPFVQWLEGLVEQTDTGFRATIYSRDAAGALLGRRELASEGQGCAALRDAVALTLALAIDPEAALRTPDPEQTATGEGAQEEPALSASEPEPELESALDAEPGAADAPPTSGTQSPSRAPAEHARISLGAVGSYNLVPGLGGGVRLTVDGAIVPHLRWIAAVHYWAEQRAERAGASFGIALTSFSAGICAGKALEHLRFDGCVTLDLGAIWAAVYAPDPLQPGGRIHAGATALLRLETRVLGPLWVGIIGGVVVPFVRHAFLVQGRSDVVFESSAVAPMAGAELALHFY